MLFGVGMTSLAIVALGVALLVLAIGLVAGHRDTQWRARLGRRHGARAQRLRAAGLVRVRPLRAADRGRRAGRAGRLVRMRDPRVPVAKWPDVGASLPIMVAIDDPRHVRILWDEVLTHAEAATADLPQEFDHFDTPDDSLLINEEAPLWARREPDDELPPPDESAAADLDDGLASPRKEPVVMRPTPGGPGRCLEGTLVNAPPSSPLPRRPRPTPARRSAPE